jgi:hypothetical protein
MYPVSREASIQQNRRRIAPRDCRGAICLPGLMLLLLLAGCGRVQQANPSTQDSYLVTLATDPAPPLVADGAVIVTLRDAAGQPVDGAQLTVEANMSHAGMAPVFGSASAGQGGAYRVPLKWSMGGDWFVDVKFTLPDGKIVARRFPVSVTEK